MPSAPYDLNISAARTGALFASPLQRSDEPSTSQVQQAIATAIGVHGVRGCAAHVAQANGGGDSLRCVRRSVWRGGAFPCPCSGADGDRAAQHPAPRLRTISYWYGDACRVKSSAYVPLRASSSECVPDSTTDPSRNT